MKITNVLFGLFAALLLVFTGTDSYSQTQASINTQAYAKYQKADIELNAIYHKILKEYASKPVFIKNLKAAQRLWVQLRNADLAAKYPEPGSYGSMEPMCKAAYLETLTKDRTKFLKVWLDGVAEGNACSGSVKMK